MSIKRKILMVTAVVLLSIQLVPVSRENPLTPPEWEIEAPPEIKETLNRACYDCHSNQTNWPLYAYVAPVSWLVAYDTVEGRKKLNFSEWGQLSEKRKSKKAEESADMVLSGDMPLPIYISVHPEADLTDSERKRLHDWFYDLQ